MDKNSVIKSKIKILIAMTDGDRDHVRILISGGIIIIVIDCLFWFLTTLIPRGPKAPQPPSNPVFS